ncbi:Beta-L-arabinofuranosidase [Arabidopsis thaliana x Arabidopsis arenosa]|uniref:Beta-L-arabinofuranosidase n=1 Tax=Arabidopsis thaliana x Arabidopsis arenosa TaxID=1240361 RepID=A0A8T1YVX8_9BRAS|nr:Beta-L-arabinofuranosidase [Arabidopsis thaliana x Arabidopsis arenosa]
MKYGLIITIALLLYTSFVLVCVAKECTNTPSQLSSHTFRNELLQSKNETLKTELFSHYHLTPTDDAAWSTLLPRKMLKEVADEFAWTMLYRKFKDSNSSGNFLKEVSLHDVRLDPNSFHGRAQQTNLEYLLMLDVDGLAWSFRKEAGLDAPGDHYGGWEKPDSELRGHFVGHYLSATAYMWASTHNDTLKAKMSALVSALSECQQKSGTGYLSAFPSSFFDRFEAITPVWAPYYTIHKILAGLVDQYKLAGNSQALQMATGMADYFYGRVRNVIRKYSVERHWQSLNEETGGMNDVLYQLYSITGDSKYLLLAHLFDKPCFLGVLAIQADDISGFHSNTHIPIVVGSQQRYEITGDPLHKEISMFFMDIVNASHSYATGGTSVSEFWQDPKRMATTLQTENEESCTTYNMLKVSRNLFRWTKEVSYADYYERALTNGVLGIQRGTQPGRMIYMLPLGKGVSKAVTYHGWGTPYDSFWCCYGTGIESFSKLGDSIYFQEDGASPALYVTQYISSSLDWKSAGLLLSQKVNLVVSWDPYMRVTFTLSSSKVGVAKESTLNLRIPVWTNSIGAKVSLNGQPLKVPTSGNFLSIKQNWKSGDQVTMELPMSIRTEAIKDDRPEYASLQAILYGPYLLAGHTSRDWSITTQAKAGNWITPIPETYNSHLVTLSQQSGNISYVLSNSNQTITMRVSPEPGTQDAVAATFRLVTADNSKPRISGPEALIGSLVMLEPFDFPGMIIKQATDSSLTVQASSPSDKGASSFRLVSGVDGKPGSVSLTLESKKGCFVYSDQTLKQGTKLRLECGSAATDEKFNKAASFKLNTGMNQYNPMSFVMSGTQRNFVLSPLFSLRDETYNVYFSVQT